MSEPEICLHCGGIDMHYDDCAWPTMGQSLEPEREAQERIAELENALAAANARADRAEAKAKRLERDAVSMPTDRERLRVVLEALGDVRHLATVRADQRDAAIGDRDALREALRDHCRGCRDGVPFREPEGNVKNMHFQHEPYYVFQECALTDKQRALLKAPEAQA